MKHAFIALMLLASSATYAQGPHAQRDTIPLTNSYICDTFINVGGTQVYIAIEPTRLIKWNYYTSGGQQGCNWKYELHYYIQSNTSFYTLQGTVNNTNFFNLPNSGCTGGCSGYVYTANNSASNCAAVNFTLADQIRIEIHNANIPSQNILLNCNSFTVLNVQLTEFTSVKDGRSNQLDWSTLSETNNDYFTLERSADGVIWDYVTQVNGAGTTDQEQHYSFNDFGFESGINYYRLSQTNYDGKSRTFDILKVDNSGGNKVLERIVNMLGEEVTADYQGIKLYLYSDGEVVKRF